MVPIKEFTTAIKVADAEDREAEGGPDADQWPFKVDGVECMAFKPGSGQLAVLIATTANHSSEVEQVAGIINFFASVLDDQSHHYLVQKLLDRRDPFGISEVTEIMEAMVEEWTGDPTKQPSDYLPSRKPGGQKSKPRTPALT